MCCSQCSSWNVPLDLTIISSEGALLSHRAARIVAALQPGCEEMEREWGNEEEMERKWGNGERLTLYISSFSLYFLPLSPFPPSLSISYIKMHHILLQNVKYGTFVANVTKISTYALWGNNSGSNLLRGSSAIRAGLLSSMAFCLKNPQLKQNEVKLVDYSQWVRKNHLFI